MDNKPQKQTIQEIARVESDFTNKFGVPRQSGRVPSNISKIVFKKEFSDPNAFREIKSFSHIWILFDFSLSHKNEFSPTVRPPRLGGNKRVGVFASRSPFRPNNIGLSCVKLIDAYLANNGQYCLTVSGGDMINGTPVYDIKPYLPSADCIKDAVGGYADAFTNYKLKVEINRDLLNKITKDKQSALIECLSDDPRPSYIDNDKRKYKMNFDNKEITFSVKDLTLTVIDIE